MHKIVLDEEQEGECLVNADDVDQVVLVVSALTPSITEVATDRYEVRGVGR